MFAVVLHQLGQYLAHQIAGLDRHLQRRRRQLCQTPGKRRSALILGPDLRAVGHTVHGKAGFWVDLSLADYYAPGEDMVMMGLELGQVREPLRGRLSRLWMSNRRLRVRSWSLGWK